jgi:hypothetical protein
MSIGEIPLPWPAEINLSRPALTHVLAAIENGMDITTGWTPSIQCEVDNFCNLLQNLLERLPETGNLDLVGG